MGWHMVLSEPGSYSEVEGGLGKGQSQFLSILGTNSKDTLEDEEPHQQSCAVLLTQ